MVHSLLQSYAAAGYYAVDAQYLTLAVSDSSFAKKFVEKVMGLIEKPGVKGVLLVCNDFGHTCGWLCSKKSIKHLEFYPTAVGYLWHGCF